jgi:SAM-dependent methyltransferase
MQETPDHFRETVCERFAKVAVAPDQEKKFPVGPTSAKSLGYEPDEIDALPLSATESYCGVGNPFGLGDLQPGQTILDLGSGAGLDSILAARRVRPSGKVIGVDMTQEMLVKAKRNVEAVGLTNVEFRQGTLEALPVEDKTIDVAISNGVFNLCGDKPKVVSEVFRVLRPGARLQMADILLHGDVRPEELAEKGTWSD